MTATRLLVFVVVLIVFELSSSGNYQAATAAQTISPTSASIPAVRDATKKPYFEDNGGGGSKGRIYVTINPQMDIRDVRNAGVNKIIEEESLAASQTTKSTTSVRNGDHPSAVDFVSVPGINQQQFLITTSSPVTISKKYSTTTTPALASTTSTTTKISRSAIASSLDVNITTFEALTTTTSARKHPGTILTSLLTTSLPSHASASFKTTTTFESLLDTTVRTTTTKGLETILTTLETSIRKSKIKPEEGALWPVKKEAVVEGDIVLGGLMMVHEREDSVTCGPVMPQGGIQALEAMLYTLDRLNDAGPEQVLPNVTLGAHILDDCDKDTYGLEMAVDFIKEICACSNYKTYNS